MKNLHFIKVTYLGATDTLGSRIRLTSYRLGESVTLSRDYQYNNGTEQAIAYLQSKGLPIIGRCEVSQEHDGIIVQAVNGQFQSIK